MAIIYNTNYTHNPNSYLTLAIKQAAEQLFGKENIVVADNLSLGRFAASGEHDTLLCIDGQRLNTALMHRVRPTFKTMILWTFEDPFMKDFNAEAGPLFDYVFTNDPSCVSAYQGKGHYLPLASSRWLHERSIQSAASLEYDLFFAGTMWPNRVRTLRRVIAAFPDARLKLICPGNEYLPPLPEDIAALALQRPVSHEAFIDFANMSAVTLTMFRDYASHGNVSQATAPGPRFFELGLAGTAQVVEVAPQMDVEHFRGVDGIQLAYNADEVVESVARLLDNKAARRRAAGAAQKSVLKNHLYDYRLERIREITQANFARRDNKSIPLTERRYRLRVLLCTHSTIYEAEWGGVEVYQRTLCSLLGRDVEFFYWLRRDNHCRLLSASGQELERFDIAEKPWQDVVCDAAEETMFSSVIGQYNIDVVHFQHLGHHALSLPIIAKSTGAGVIFSAHDFWLISSRYNLLNQDWRHVEGEFLSVLSMDIMLKIAEGVEYGGEQTRRAFISRMLHHVDAIMFGTNYSRDLMHKVYPVLDHKISLVNGIPSPEPTVPITPKKYEPLQKKPLGVAIVGNFLRTKGADTILALIEAARPGHFHFHIFGYVHPDYQGVFDRMNRADVTVHGRYDIGSTNVLEQADVSLALSIWPETYCISLSETWRHGLIPIVTDVGALGDRVDNGKNGFKVPISRPDIVLERLELLRSSNALRQQMMAEISPKLWTHEKEYGAGLFSLYRRIAPRRSMGVAELQLDVGQLHMLPFESWRHQAPPRHIFDPPILRDLSVELPSNIVDWFAIQGAQCYVDDICHCVLSEGYERRFKPADEFHIRGWTFLPDVSVSGQIYVVLVSDNPDDSLIFMQAQREIRSDISKLFGGNVPRRSGFAVQAALRGKWCEGRYRIGLINAINGRGAFQLLSHGVEIEGGKIQQIYTSPPSNDVILSDFRRLLESDSLLRGIRLTRFPRGPLYRHERGVLHYFIDTFEIIGEEGSADHDRGALMIRGWSFLEDLTRSGHIFVVFVQAQQNDIGIFATKRFARNDVQSVYRDAPLCAGFHEVLRPWQGQVNKMNGMWHIALVNIVNDTFGITTTDLRVSLKNGRIIDVDRQECSAEQSERVSALTLRVMER